MENDERLRLDPQSRIIFGTGLAAICGLTFGTARGAQISSLRFLAENAHRLPRTKGGWYFFHKRKNYVLLRDGINQGIVLAAKYGAAAYAFFSLEAIIDRSRGRKDFVSTTLSASSVGAAVAFIFARLPLRQACRSTLHFSLFGTVVGLMEDGLSYIKSASLIDPIPSETKSDTQSH